jgi:hypothetical protein
MVTKFGAGRYIAVLTPSPVGLIWCGLLSGLVLLFMNLSSLQAVFYTPEELSIQSDFWHSINNSVSNVLGLNGNNTLFFYIFWAIVGLAVYGVLHIVLSKLSELSDDLNLRHNIWPDQRLRNRPLQRFVEISLFRVFIFILLFLYIKAAFGFMLRPIGQIWADNSWLENSNFLKYTFVFLVQVLLLHGLVVLLRLLLLRKRLTGQN